MATESQKDEMIKYLLLVMKYTEFKPDYHKIAQECGLSNANTAQKRFKKIVELGGFGLVHGAVVQPGGSDVAPSTPAKAKAESKKPAATPTPSKKRKRNATTPCKEEDEDEGVKQEVGAEQKE